jgi:hypothetical protein
LKNINICSINISIIDQPNPTNYKMQVHHYIVKEKGYDAIPGIKHVICGSKLSDVDKKSLILSGIIKEGEEIARLYAHGGWSDGLDLSDTMVGISDVAIFKYEKHKVTARILLSDITIAKHHDNGLFKWDKIELGFKYKQSETIGIYHGSACEHFTQFINQLIDKRAE